MVMKFDEAMMLLDTHERLKRDSAWRPEVADDLVDAVVQDMVGLVAGKFDCISATMIFTREEGDRPTVWTAYARVGWKRVGPDDENQFAAAGHAPSRMSAAFACVKHWDQKRQKLLEKKDEP